MELQREINVPDEKAACPAASDIDALVAARELPQGA